MTYSQFGQDDAIVEIFKNVRFGHFIDVGANSKGEDTILLEEAGWRGICIEPLDEQFKELKEKRKCICVNVCVGDTSGGVDFLNNTGYTNALSGVVEYYCTEHKQRITREIVQMGGSTRIEKKEMKTLTSILDEHNFPPYIELLKIDVEGGEIAVLRGIDFSKYEFGLITLEENYEHEAIACKDFLHQHGYTPFTKIGIDMFYNKKLSKSETVG